MNRRMISLRPALLNLAAAMLLAACGGAGTTPETHYYRLPGAAGLAALDTPATATTLVVAIPRAKGVHNERPIVYSDEPGGVTLKQYHQHYWEESPAEIIQAWMIEYLRTRNVSPVVVRRATIAQRITLNSWLHRFERLLSGNGRSVIVDLEFRVDATGVDAPLLIREYRSEQVVERADMEGTVLAFGAAMEDIMQRFTRDLERALAGEG